MINFKFTLFINNFFKHFDYYFHITTSYLENLCIMSMKNMLDADSVVGPTGEQLTLDDLPPTDTKRWVVRRKAEVVAAVRGGLLSLEDACRKYTLSVEEFLSWQRAIDEDGLLGLRTTRVQDYRQDKGNSHHH